MSKADEIIERAIDAALRNADEARRKLEMERLSAEVFEVVYWEWLSEESAEEVED